MEAGDEGVRDTARRCRAPGARRVPLGGGRDEDHQGPLRRWCPATGPISGSHRCTRPGRGSPGTTTRTGTGWRATTRRRRSRRATTSLSGSAATRLPDAQGREIARGLLFLQGGEAVAGKRCLFGLREVLEEIL